MHAAPPHFPSFSWSRKFNPHIEAAPGAADVRRRNGDDSGSDPAAGSDPDSDSGSGSESGDHHDRLDPLIPRSWYMAQKTIQQVQDLDETKTFFRHFCNGESAGKQTHKDFLFPVDPMEAICPSCRFLEPRRTRTCITPNVYIYANRIYIYATFFLGQPPVLTRRATLYGQVSTWMLLMSCRRCSCPNTMPSYYDTVHSKLPLMMF
jgi:hypothetical protein